MEDIYIAEFVVHEGISKLPKIDGPSVVLRFLQFPPLTVPGTGKLIFGKGKSCKFSMAKDMLVKSLQSTPLYVMLVDKHSKLIATSALDLSVFAESEISTRSNFKRNSIDMYDPVKNIVARLDISISIHQQKSDLTGDHAKEVFKNIVHEPIVKLDKGTDKGVGTDPITRGNRDASEKATSTDTLPVAKPDPSIFEGAYQPPPMFLCNPKQKNERAVRAPVEVPVKRPARPEIPRTIPEDTSQNLLIDRLLEELQMLKAGRTFEEGKLPDPIVFKKERPTLNLQTRTISGLEIAPVKVSMPSHRLSEYSDDFEEESISQGFSTSLDKLVKCFVCGEMIRARDAGQHKNCRRTRKSNILSPRDEFEVSQSYRDNKSIATSIIEEYASDFEEESYA